MARLPLLMTTLLLATALAGCSDDGGSADFEPADSDAEPAPSDAPGDATGDLPDAPEAPADLPVLYLNGTITGAVDCQLAAQAGTAPAGPQQSTSVSVPAEAVGRSYAVEVGASGLPEDPGAATLCVSWDGGTTWDPSSSGTVPEGATELLVAADTAYENAFSVRID